MDVNGQNYVFERATSICKDQEIYFYLGIANNCAINQKIILKLRFYDCFRNEYSQKTQITNTKEYVSLNPYSDVHLEKTNKSMYFI